MAPKFLENFRLHRQKKFTSGKNLKLVDKKTIFVDETVSIGDNVIIYENNRIEGKTKIGNNCIILPGNHIKDCTIGDRTTIESSHISGATIDSDTSVGPFSRIRPTTSIGKNCKIGNFVEIKNSQIDDGTKVSHLAYVGDSTVGKNCNIGCGVVFVNYNGVLKNRSIVEDNCFIGSNSNIIAPVTIHQNSYICAGTTITESVNAGDLVIGRIKQEAKPDRASAYLEKQRQIKEERKRAEAESEKEI